MINQILKDSSVINQTEKYHLIHLSLNEIEDIILNCNEFKCDKFEKLRFLIEKNKTTFKVTGKVYDKLSELIRDNFVRLNWINISRNQILSENFIREFQYKVDWEYISLYQKLSEDFIREF